MLIRFLFTWSGRVPKLGVGTSSSDPPPPYTGAGEGATGTAVDLHDCAICSASDGPASGPGPNPGLPGAPVTLYPDGANDRPPFTLMAPAVPPAGRRNAPALIVRLPFSPVGVVAPIVELGVKYPEGVASPRRFGDGAAGTN